MKSYKIVSWRKFILTGALYLSVLFLSAQFRVIGYLPVGGDLQAEIKQVDLKKITHLNLAFINPDSTGVFMQLAGLDSLIAQAHINGVKVCMSMGGGSAPFYFHHLLTPDLRDSLVGNIIQFAVANHFDGVDVDLEGSFIDENYDVFLTALRRALTANRKLLTIAIATAYAESITDHALEQPDFINIMSYDKTGPWTPDKPGEHAPFSMALQDVEYWSTTRGIAKNRLSLGLPFYGYQFSPTSVNGLAFSEIVSLNAAAVNNDTVILPDGSVIYYNGIPTIQSKTNLALQQLGGVMIWQLLQDATGNASLLNTVYETIRHQR
jgi:chitinase